MKLQFKVKNFKKDAEIEKLLITKLQKFGRLLERFNPDELTVEIVIEKNAHKDFFDCRITLPLPHKRLSASDFGYNVEQAFDKALDDLKDEFKKYKDHASPASKRRVTIRKRA